MKEKSTQQKKVLIIDDDPGTCGLLTYLFCLNGYNATNANSGREALTLAELIEPDLIILDVMMPGMDGWEVMQQLKDSNKIPVIFISAMDTGKARERSLELGGKEFIGKPFNLKELIRKTDALLTTAQL
jgi:DNA-binding response OmpR family regulator